MKQLAWIATLLLSPALMFAAPASDASSASGLWKIDGDVMGTPVKMMCTLAEANSKLSGTCSGAQDGYAPHQVSGKVKAQTVEWHFETAMQGNAISVIISGTLNDDRSKMTGDLDVEPMGVSGSFAGMRTLSSAGASPVAAQAPAAPPATEVSAAARAGDTWKIEGDVQGTPVRLTCILIEADKKLAGTCAGAAEDMTPRKLEGDVTEKSLTWFFDTEYQGNPITVSMSGTRSPDGTKMSGTMAVAPMGVDGTFTAVKQ